MRAILSLMILIGTTCAANAQLMTQTTVPFNQIGTGFYENNSVGWSLRGPNFFAQFGGAAAAPAPFGNPDPNAGLRTGFGFGNGSTRGNIGFNFAQGSSRSISSSSASVTSLNGVPGSITSQTIRPFVTGITPVVSDYPTFGAIPGYGQQMAQSVQQAQQADFQRRTFASNNARQKKALESFRRGQRAESEGDKKMARANYRRALASAEGPLRVEVIKRMQANGWLR